ncbi:APC family permease [Solimonas marina]|uniref:APC family permease n=1 Tax=Solimonas marina TaxID=2714601 RepID=UPI0019CFD51B
MKPPAQNSSVSLLGAISIGIGGMVGGGIFAVLGLAVELAGGATPASFLVAGIVALLTSYSYAKLSVAYPSRGGTVVFIDRAFGVDFFTGTSNNLLWVGYIVTLALYAVAFGNYAQTFLPDSLQSAGIRHLLISAGIVLPMLLNFLSSSLISRAESTIVGIKIAILLLVVIAGFANVDPARLAPETWTSFSQMVGGGMIIFVAYEGFELIANTAPDVRDYRRTLPRAYYASVGFVIVLYVLVAIVTVGSIAPDQIAAAKDFALAQAAKPSLGMVGFTLVATAAVLATLSAINATLYGAARLSYVIATEGELPGFLKERIWNQPLVGLFVTTVLALLLANLVDLSSISTMGSAGFLVIFAIVNAANFKQAHAVGSSRLIAGLGTLACAFALGALVWHTLQTDAAQLWVLIVMVGIAAAIEGAYLCFWKAPQANGRVTSSPSAKIDAAAR